VSRNDFSVAEERGVPPFVVFGDASLRDMARRRTQTEEEFLKVPGVGERKLADTGPLFLAELKEE